MSCRRLRGQQQQHTARRRQGGGRGEGRGEGETGECGDGEMGRREAGEGIHLGRPHSAPQLTTEHGAQVRRTKL